MAKHIWMFAFVVFFVAPRLAVAQTAAPAPCINGRMDVRLERMTVRVPCREGQPPQATVARPTASAQQTGAAPAVPVTSPMAGAVVAPHARPIATPSPTPVVAHPPAPLSDSWARMFVERERAQQARLQAAPRPHTPPAEEAAAEPPPAPGPAPLAALPSTFTFQVNVQFVNFTGILTFERVTPQGIVCITRTPTEGRIERMSEEQRRQRCREWEPRLGSHNDYAQPFTLESGGSWVLTRYARVADGNRRWHTVQQSYLQEGTSYVRLMPGDVRGGADQLPRYLPDAPRALPARAVAHRSHHRPRHGTRRTHVRNARACR